MKINNLVVRDKSLSPKNSLRKKLTANIDQSRLLLNLRLQDNPMQLQQVLSSFGQFSQSQRVRGATDRINAVMEASKSLGKVPAKELLSKDYVS